MKHVKRPPREKRGREKRQRIPTRASRAQVHYLRPDPDKPHRVQVFISPTRLHMRATVRFKEAEDVSCAGTAGMVQHYSSKVTGRYVVRPGLIIARMFLNAVDLRVKPTEITTHECGHAAMAWARLRRADLSKMPGEEVMCYALGHMNRQLCNLLYRLKIFP